MESSPNRTVTAYKVQHNENNDDRAVISVESTSHLQNVPKRTPKCDRDGKLKRKGFGKPRSLYQKYSYTTTNSWMYELVGVIICVSSLVSIVAILFAFDDCPTPHDAAGLSLNTIIATLATLCRSTIILLVSSVMLQQKWVRFWSGFRSLNDVLLYDDAARGPFGSLNLLGTMKLGLVASLTAAVAVLVLGLEPFVQQSVRHILKDQLISSTMQSMQPILQNDIPNDKKPLNSTATIIASINQALYSDAVEPIQPTCVGTSCDWPLYGSVAFCSSCENAIDDVSIEPKFDTILQYFTTDNYYGLGEFSFLDLNLGTKSLDQTLSTEYHISLGESKTLKVNSSINIAVEIIRGYYRRSHHYPATVVWSLYENQTSDPHIWSDFAWLNSTINNVSRPLSAFGYVTLKPSADYKQLIATSAKRCIISICAQGFSQKISNGTLSSNITETNWGTYGKPVFNNSDWLDWKATLGGSHSPSSFSFSRTYILMEIMVQLSSLVGSVSNSRVIDFERGIDSEADDSASSDTNSVQFLKDVENNCAKIAQSLTNMVQQHGDGHIIGRAYISRTFIEVSWGWLAFPITLVIMILVTFIATMVQTKRHKLPIWKSSPFPLLYNLTDIDGHDVLGGIDNATKPPPVLNSSHQDMAKTTYLRLRPTRGSWMFEKYRGKT